TSYYGVRIALIIFYLETRIIGNVRPLFDRLDYGVFVVCLFLVSLAILFEITDSQGCSRSARYVYSFPLAEYCYFFIACHHYRCLVFIMFTHLSLMSGNFNLPESRDVTGIRIREYPHYFLDPDPISLGRYFLFDAFDIISHRYASQKVDVLFHHLVVTTSASYVVQTAICSSYLLCGLLAELSGYARQSLITRINVFLNFLTHAIFRLGPTSVLLRGVFKDGGRPPFLIACYGIGCIFALSILNVVMLMQLIRADFCRRSNDSLHIKKEKFTEFLNDDWSLNNQQRVENGNLACDKIS
uniref:TLC domain-containing protein n=1 Tax=Romanomermis culicivorax TaxID=13658 RepID=A0A915IPF6_ROMCU